MSNLNHLFLTSTFLSANLSSCGEEMEESIDPKDCQTQISSINNEIGECMDEELFEGGECLQSGTIDYPDCGASVEIRSNGEIWASVPISEGSIRTWGELDEMADCALDSYYNRDCREVRRASYEKLESLPSTYECPSGGLLGGYEGEAKFKADTDISEVRNFNYVENAEDCGEYIDIFNLQIIKMMERMTCHDGTVFEKLGWGEALHGVTYNPCSGIPHIC